MKYEIRELAISEIFDQAFAVIKDNAGVLLAIVCVLQLPLQVFYAIAMAPYQLNLQHPELTRPPDVNFLIIISVFLVLNLFVGPLTHAALINAIAEAYLGRKPTIGGSFSRALRRFVPLILTWLLVGVVTLGGLVLCVIPGILFIIWLALATVVVVLEPCSSMEALGRSKELMKGYALKWFVLLLVVGAISLGLGTAALLVGIISGYLKIGSVLNAVVQTMGFTLVGGTVLVVLYFSARCTHENFDLDLLAHSFGEAGSGGTAGEDPTAADDNPFQQDS